MNEYLNPDWENATRVHDWKNHVPDHIKDKWETYGEVMKRDLFIWAEEMSNNEEWD